MLTAVPEIGVEVAKFDCTESVLQGMRAHAYLAPCH